MYIQVVILLAKRVVQRTDKFIHCVNCYPAEEMYSNQYILFAG